ncbi:hypothetical protein OZX73_08560 [Bifidobacterium sp. ESL0775]|uniref:hypothetical protein n=1 Tax=Bifidobacterium sp. ESL0775 TaxID=2983230 RepID=UPI0023F9A7E8|nr:hypothetical protein [Bifidobacterium sp. ESL0775]WEV69292.1 hypothetical protein OZX73_08560 [Bifidobacterium sp. ESL0775]
MRDGMPAETLGNLAENLGVPLDDVVDACEYVAWHNDDGRPGPPETWRISLDLVADVIACLFDGKDAFTSADDTDDAGSRRNNETHDEWLERVQPPDTDHYIIGDDEDDDTLRRHPRDWWRDRGWKSYDEWSETCRRAEAEANAAAKEKADAEAAEEAYYAAEEAYYDRQYARMGDVPEGFVHITNPKG